MKKLSFKAIISMLLVVVLSFSVIYVPGLSMNAYAADCGSGKHDFSVKSNEFPKSNATCTSPAIYYYACSKCGISSALDTGATYEKGDKKGHQMGEWVNFEPSCTENGGTKQSCQRANCEYTYVKYNDKTATGHSVVTRTNNDGTHTTYCTKVSCDYQKVDNCSTKKIACGVISTCDVCNTKYGGPVQHDLINETITKAPTCTEDGEASAVCSRCTYTEKSVVKATGHKGVLTSEIKETCETAGVKNFKCSACNLEYKEDIAAPGHDYNKTVVAPTCRAEGYDFYQCKNCEKNYKTNYNANLAHNYKETVTEATCTNPGSTLYTCQTCGYFETGKFVEALGHDMSGYIVEKAPTCTEKGLQVDKCSRCSLSISMVIEAKGHTTVDTVVPPSCTEVGYTQHVCSDCKITTKDTYVDALGHDNQLATSIPATCTETGMELYTCRVCFANARKTLPALGHNFEYTSNNDAKCEIDGTKTGKCTRCNTTEVVTDKGSALKHKFTVYAPQDAATCTKNATQWSVCDNGCGTKDIQEIPNSALGHKPEIIPAVAATCNSTGLTEGQKCKVCNDILLKQETTNKLEHDYTKEVVTAPTCAKPGTANYTCILCGDKYTGDVEATGVHTWDNGKDTVVATCDGDGEKVLTCTVCGETKKETVNRLGHNWATEFTVDVQATCYRVGSKSKHCSRCDGTIETTEIPKTDHQFGELQPNGDATCEYPGTVSRKCKFCTEVADTQPGQALGHDYTDYTPDGNATCTKDGTKSRTCKRQGCDYKDTLPDEGSKTGHTEVINEAKAVTCTENGLTEGKTCSVCSEILVAQEVIEATGHTEAKKDAVAATCTTTGLTEGSYCIVCKKDILEQTVIPKLGHDYSKVLTQATTSANGQVQCTICGNKATVYKASTIKLSTSKFYYNGEPQVPEKAVVKDSKGNALVEDVDYEITYGDMGANVGTYKVKIVLKGKYKGSKTLSFKIIPAKIEKVKTSRTTTSVKLVWSKTPGATAYRIYLYNTSTKKWDVVCKGTKSTNWTATKLKAGTTYLFSIKPYNRSDDGVVWGESKRWETATQPATPTVKGASNSSRSATVTWNKVTGATGYIVYYSTEKNGSYKRLGKTDKLTYTETKLTALKSYYFKVKAYKTTANGNVFSAVSKPVKVSVKL